MDNRLSFVSESTSFPYKICTKRNHALEWRKESKREHNCLHLMWIKHEHSFGDTLSHVDSWPRDSH